MLSPNDDKKQDVLLDFMVYLIGIGLSIIVWILGITSAKLRFYNKLKHGWQFSYVCLVTT